MRAQSLIIAKTSIQQQKKVIMPILEHQRKSTKPNILALLPFILPLLACGAYALTWILFLIPKTP
jgi:hypothetical protein